MKVKFMSSNSTYELEKLINDFIKDKELIDIKYQILKTDGLRVAYYSALIMYDEYQYAPVKSKEEQQLWQKNGLQSEVTNPHGTFRVLSEDDIRKILELHSDGLLDREIAEIIGCSRELVSRKIRKGGLR